MHQKCLARSICGGTCRRLLKPAGIPLSLSHASCAIRLLTSGTSFSHVRPRPPCAAEHSPHWARGAFAVEEAREPFLRLICSTRSLPRCLPVPSPPHSLCSFTLMAPALHLPSRRPAMRAGRSWWTLLRLCQMSQCWPCGGPRGRCHPAVSQGLVPRGQSIARAELCALVHAVQIAQKVGTQCRIHVDASAALRAVGATLDGAVPHKFAHQDLLASLPCSQVPLDKLRSAMGNMRAEKAAGAARLADLDIVTEGASQIASWRREQARRLTTYYEYLIALAKL